MILRQDLTLPLRNLGVGVASKLPLPAHWQSQNGNSSTGLWDLTEGDILIPVLVAVRDHLM